VEQVILLLEVGAWGDPGNENKMLCTTDLGRDNGIYRAGFCSSLNHDHHDCSPPPTATKHPHSLPVRLQSPNLSPQPTL
jgi:hypothetical protein